MTEPKGKAVTQAIEHISPGVDQTLDQVLGDSGRQLSVPAVVRALVDSGIRREDAVSRLHDEIASGHIVLTTGFMVTRNV